MDVLGADSHIFRDIRSAASDLSYLVLKQLVVFLLVDHLLHDITFVNLVPLEELVSSTRPLSVLVEELDLVRSILRILVMLKQINGCLFMHDVALSLMALGDFSVGVGVADLLGGLCDLLVLLE